MHKKYKNRQVQMYKYTKQAKNTKYKKNCIKHKKNKVQKNHLDAIYQYKKESEEKGKKQETKHLQGNIFQTPCPLQKYFLLRSYF